jgi:hypothetical protein
MTEQTSSPADIQATLDHVVDPYSGACGCMGPQGDEPVCPCAMRNVIRWRGRWVQLKVIGNDGPGKGFLDILKADGYQVQYPTVMLCGFEDGQKIPVIRVVREVTDLSLSEAKNLVEKSLLGPVAIWEDATRDRAALLKHKFEEVGGRIEYQ